MPPRTPSQFPSGHRSRRRGGLEFALSWQSAGGRWVTCSCTTRLREWVGFVHLLEAFNR